MQSTRGVINTNVAMVECAGGQNKKRSEIFLLSELEKVWVTVSILVRKRLLDEKFVQIPHIGSFFYEDKVLFSDQHNRKYHARKLLFCLNHSFAIRYGIDTGKNAIEKTNVHYSKIALAEVVDVCGVPAKTVSMALKEFAMYLGEGIHSKKVYNIHLPGVATLTMKRELITLLTTWEMQMDLFRVDCRKWSPELQNYGVDTLIEKAQSFGVDVSGLPLERPESRLSTKSWEAPPSSTPQQKFVGASAGGRLFSDIEREAEKRKQAAKQKMVLQREAEQLQEAIDRRIRHYDCAVMRDTAEEEILHSRGRLGEGPRGTRLGEPAPDRTRTPSQAQLEQRRRVAQRESIYNVIQEEEEEDEDGSEPEIQTIEIIADEDEVEEQAQPSPERFLRMKDAELERVLREEEPFSRPISRQAHTQHSSVRDLIYGERPNSTENKENACNFSNPNNNYNMNREKIHVGRKRLDVGYSADTDHIRNFNLLKDQD